MAAEFGTEHGLNEVQADALNFGQSSSGSINTRS
jgi:hypothetical protein